MEKDINEKLRDLYSHLYTLLPEAVAKRNDDGRNHRLKISNPWLLKVPSEYINARKRVMLIGQEAYGWCGVYSSDKTVDFLQGKYKDFCNAQTTKGKYRPSPIWNLYRSIIE